MMEIKYNEKRKRLRSIIIEQFDLPILNIILPLMFIVFGILLGSISSGYLNISQETEMENYFIGFLNLVNRTTINRTELFQTALLNNTKVFLLLVFMSVSVIGIPFVYGILTVKGFIVGFTAGIITKTLSGRGVLMIVCLILPKELILLPAYMYIGALSVNLCSNMMHTIIKKKHLDLDYEKLGITKYMARFIPCYILILIGCFVEAYICPVLLKIAIR